MAETPPDYRLHRRFDRMARLVGDPAMERLSGAFVVVLGLGGVGSFAAEALARSGVGRLRLVDFDLICVTNTNRQLHTLKGSIGQRKCDQVAERLRRVNPKAEIEARCAFYSAETAEMLLAGEPDYVLDAIDHVTGKCHLIATCRARGQRLVCAMGAAGRWDPTQLRTADLADTTHDPLAAAVRRILREKHGFPAQGPYGVEAVYTTEPVQPPRALAYDNGQGFRCSCPQGQNGLFECDKRNRIDGSASFVTGAFGLAAAAVVVRDLCADRSGDG